MWRMQDGDRVLTEAEWALLRVGLGNLWDFIEDDGIDADGLSETGVRVFDALQPAQKLALLADVGQALRNPAVPTPRHTAANEGAIAAVFATIRRALEEEIALDAVADEPSAEVRSLLLAAAESDDPPEDLPALSDDDRGNWGWVLEAIEGRIFWDADYEMGDAFMDRPPEEARELLGRMTIDPEYYTAIPREPDEAGLVPVRQALARLLGRPVPDDAGLYPALADQYHDLAIGPCSPEEVAAWTGHPWVEVAGLTDPRWECDFATWTRHFRDALPAAPFALPESSDAGTASPEGCDGLPDGCRAERHREGWVVRDGSGSFWCDALSNGWSPDPDEACRALTFRSRTEAVAAYKHAARMYDERAARRKAAMSILGKPEDA
jgi:hypothetical protein